MAEILHLSNENFHDIIDNSEKPVLIDFWAQWCGPCKFFAPIFEELNDERGDKVLFAKVDVDNCPDIAVEYNIRSIPTLLLFKNGEQVMGLVGSASKDILLEKIDSWL